MIVMERKVLHVVRSCFSSEVISLLAIKFKAEEEKVRSALGHTIPLAVNSLLNMGQAETQTDVVGQLAREAAAAGLPHNATALPTTGWGARGSMLMEALLDDAYGMILHCLAAATGIRPVEGETILGHTMALTLGALGELATQEQLREFELLAWILGQKEEIVQAVPAYSRRPLAEPLVKTTALTAEPVASDKTYDEGIGTGQSKPQHMLRWQLAGLLVLAVGLGYAIGHDPNPKPPIPSTQNEDTAPPASTASLVTTSTSPSTSTPAPASGPATGARTISRTETDKAALIPGRYDLATDTYIYNTGRPTLLKLADGRTLKVGENSTENRLYQFLANSTMQVDSVNRTKGWINCDRVYFESGQAILTKGSGEQLRNIAGILRGFPAARVKFGGYTDSTGSSLKNFQLSEDRAKAAMLALGSVGINMGRIEAKGYGGKFFLTTNATPEGRAINRRVSIRVLKK
jgi:OOP family OmpA-OmpF porin